MKRTSTQPMTVEVLRRRKLLDDFFLIEEAFLRHDRFDGARTGELRRLCLVRGDAAACLPYDPVERRFFLVEQFRWPPSSVGVYGWLMEIPAGLVDAGEDPAACMARELEEETGLAARRLDHVFTYFATPGGSTERIFLYLAEVEGAGAAGRLKGKPSENEDIRVHAVPYEEAWNMMKDGRIADGKTLLALLAFRERGLDKVPETRARS
jgi:nudix-type nucleoside diphosphatase (YffH/AdpP family)